jgi:arylformamidase
MDGADDAWRTWPRDELDRQYDARGTVPDIAPFLAEYARRTAEARAAVPGAAVGLRYGRSERERLDVYPPAPGTPRPAPVLVFVHGGYWRLLSTDDSGFMAARLSRAGACVVAVDYELAPAATMDRIVAQCRAALAWTVREIAAFGGDPGRVHAAGSSAGAHLAAMLGAPGWQAGAGLPGDAVKGLVLLSGLYDLRPLVHAAPNAWLGLDEAAAVRNSPVRTPPAPPVPVVAACAPTETAEFERQTRAYADAAAAAGCPVERPAAPGTNHFDVVFHLDDTATEIGRAVRRLLRLPHAPPPEG